MIRKDPTPKLYQVWRGSFASIYKFNFEIHQEIDQLQINIIIKSSS